MTEPDVASLMSVAQAIEIIDIAPVVPQVVRVPLDQALGLHLAQDIRADRDYPPFDRSLMDGYAVRSADVAGGRTRLRCIGEIAAGDDPSPWKIESGQTIAIMTGASLPAGADAVVPVENRIDQRDEMVELKGPSTPGRYIAPRGSEVRVGEVVLQRGARLEAAQLAVAASVGAAQVDAYARPRVGVLSTGNEIVAPDQTPRPMQIRNCNSIMLMSLLRRMNCDASDLGIIRDDPEPIRDAIARGLHDHDVLLVTGGMSMGEYDFVPRVLIELGIELKITKLRIKPGKPFVFGIAPDQGFVFGLPGNPVSGFACTVRLCSRLLTRLSGATPHEKWIRAKLESPLDANGPREFHQPAILSRPQYSVRPLKWKGSADVYTLAQANCLLVRAENEPPRGAGEEASVLEIPA